ncbi:hypothetical protein GCM10009115_09130 [Sphingopyxis soli]|uniref:Uncharacterized protein n=1 Tax=Sphingopyxis soli TaxID=592051 RepID=A0ABP3X9U0_9SPHN|nr:hypothetical protein [Sphingopyxis soli]
MNDPAPAIVIGKGGGFFRVVFRESTLSPSDFNRPGTYTAHSAAWDAARLLAKATGWPVIDETKEGGNVPAR